MSVPGVDVSLKSLQFKRIKQDYDELVGLHSQVVQITHRNDEPAFAVLLPELFSPAIVKEFGSPDLLRIASRMLSMPAPDIAAYLGNIEPDEKLFAELTFLATLLHPTECWSIRHLDFLQSEAKTEASSDLSTLYAQLGEPVRQIAESARLEAIRQEVRPGLMVYLWAEATINALI